MPLSGIRQICQQLGKKVGLAKPVTPHVRHTMAMDLLQGGADRSVIALWLGHERVETTPICLEATLAMKEKALAKTSPPQGRRGRYKPGDRLLAFLNSL
jgi:site-specific recombinase XerD